MSDITGERGDVGRGWHALLHHRVRKWTQTHWQASRLTTSATSRQPGGDCRALSLTTHLLLCPPKTRWFLRYKRPICLPVVTLSLNYKSGCKLHYKFTKPPRSLYDQNFNILECNMQVYSTQTPSRVRAQVILNQCDPHTTVH